MSSIRVIDVNNEEATEQPVETPIEEAPEQPVEAPIEEVAEPDIKNVAVEETNEEVPRKRLTQKDKIQCKKCFKEMTVKSYKYSHEKNCQGQITERPVKPQAKPKPKIKPKPLPQQVQEVEEVEEETYVKPKAPVVNRNVIDFRYNSPLQDVTNHYQLLQNEYIKQKQEKYNSLCKNIFATKPKKDRLIY